MARLELRLLGTFRATLDGAPVTSFGYDKVRALLAYLAMESDHPHQRERLAGLLWPEHPERNARLNLSQALSYLRRALDDKGAKPSFLDITPQTLQFDRASDHWLDAVALTHLLDACAKHRHASRESCEECLERLEEAAALYQGPFLEGFSIPDSSAFEEWALLHRERLHRLAQETLRRLAEAYAARGEYERGLAHAWRRVELDPWREGAQRGLMRLLMLSGQRGAALAQYEACCRLLAEELGVEPAAETTALYEDIVTGAISPPVGITTPLHNLPVQTTPFVGREEEVAEIIERLEDPACRLLTLVGPGGCGKTRLALQAAEGQLERYPDGVYFVSLAAVNAPESLVPAVADAIGFSFYQGAEPQRQLLDYLREKTMLLVMDNYEHLLKPSDPTGSSGADLVAQIIRTAPGVKVLATSRARLNVGGEHRYQVAGMRYPAAEIAVQEPDEAAAYCAVKLFIQGARRARQDFELTRENVTGVVEICRLVEGMPLAVRLAAPWVALMSPKEIASQLKSCLDLLATDRKDVPERQRSVWASLDHTWRLITGRERELVEALSVFRGGFTLEAARQVIGASPPDLKALVDKSLLQFSVSTDRYEIHELLRQYAAQKLTEDPEREAAARNRHCAFFCALLGRLGAAANRGWIAGEIGQTEADWGNVQDGWERAACEGKVVRLDTALDGLAYLVLGVHQRYQEGEALLQLAVDGLTANSRSLAVDERRVLAMALIYRADCNFHTGRHELARAAAEKSRDLLDGPLLSGCDTRRERAFLHVILAEQAFPDWGVARGHIRQALELQRELGYQGQVAYRQLHLGVTYLCAGEPYKARIKMEESLTLFRALDNPVGVTRVLANLGLLAMKTRDFEEGKRRFEEALALARAQGIPYKTAHAQEQLGWLAVLQGDFDAACAHLRESIILYRTVGQRQSLYYALAERSAALRFCGEFDQAYAHIEESLIMAKAIENPLMFARAQLAWLDAAVGRYDSARKHAQKAVVAASDIGDFGRAEAQEVLGYVALAEGAYDEAGQTLRKAIAKLPEGMLFAADSQVHRAWALAIVAHAAHGLGNDAEAQQHLIEALEIAVEYREFIPLLHLLPIVTLVLAEDEDGGLKERAAQLYGLCRSQPFLARAQLFEDIAWRQVRKATSSLPPDVVAAAQERGRALDWWETAEALLSELRGWADRETLGSTQI